MNFRIGLSILAKKKQKKNKKKTYRNIYSDYIKSVNQYEDWTKLCDLLVFIIKMS